ncbi:MAG: L-threonylcarbamoyladenylate synthase [Weeksellaceae bacterium]
MLLTVSTSDNQQSIIDQTLAVLRDGGLVVFPSDTVYGLLVDATNEQAVEKLIAFKNRAPGKAISVFVADMQMAETIVETTNHASVLQKILPGPFTVVLPSKQTVSPKLHSEKNTMGIRIPDYELVQKLVKQFEKPITATSANLGGKHPHYSVTSLLNQLPEKKKELIDLIVDAGQLPRNKPSTIIDLSQAEVKILRKGDILFKNEETFISTTAEQTSKLGRYLTNNLINQANGKPIVMLLQGDLGAGKTQFTKGVAAHLGIEHIDSPTYVMYYEYETQNKQYPLLVHADLYNIQEIEEFTHLELDSYLDKKSIMVIEWGEKAGEIIESFKGKCLLAYITFEYTSETEREIKVSY